MDIESKPLSGRKVKPVAAGSMLSRLLLAVVLLLLSAAARGLDARQTGEYQVKAVFLFNVTKFVEWPSEAFASGTTPFVVGIVGHDPFGEVLPRLAKEQTARGRRLEIRHYRAEEDHSACHVLFLSRSVAAQTEKILRRLQERPVLTVSDQENFARQGGIIEFGLVDDAVRFDINAKMAERAGLKPSSKLLAVARSVVNSS